MSISHGSQSAFSLIEMLVALTIMTILIAISVPFVEHFSERTHDQLLQSTLLLAIKNAQQEAQALGVAVSICKSSDHLVCGGDWAKGVIIFIDENDEGVIHDREQVITVIQTHRPFGMLSWRAFPFYRDYLHFLPTGILTTDNATFWYCHTNKNFPAWAIKLSKSGQTHVLLPDQFGVIKDAHGQALLCEDTKDYK